MSFLKASVGTPLESLGTMAESTLLRLRALSITTVEELRGLAVAESSLTSGFLDIEPPMLQRKLHIPAVEDLELLELDIPELDSGWALGALPPPGVEVEQVASGATFDEYAESAARPLPAGEPEGFVVDLRGCVGPILHQGERFTCVSFAILAAFECVRMKAGKPLDASEQFLYWRTKQLDSRPEEKGTYIETAMAALRDSGVCTETTWVYVPNVVAGNEGQGPPPSDAEREASDHRAGGISDLGGKAVDAIRQTLDSGQPVALSVPVHKNWTDNPATASLGFIPMPLPGSERQGGHAMTAVGYGYDADFAGGGFFIVRNSWGLGWAPQSPIAPGYGALPFTYVEVFGYEAYTCAVP